MRTSGLLGPVLPTGVGRSDLPQTCPTDQSTHVDRNEPISERELTPAPTSLNRQPLHYSGITYVGGLGPRTGSLEC
jgi:hypothetical protein